MALLDGLARWLAAHGHGTYSPTGVQTADWSIFIEAQPIAPGKAITLYQYGGGESHGRQPWDEPTVQVRVRGTEDSTVSRAKAQAIYDALHGLSYVELSDVDATWVTDCVATNGGPVPVGPDGNARHVHTVNFRLSIDQPSLNRPAP